METKWLRRMVDWLIRNGLRAYVFSSLFLYAAVKHVVWAVFFAVDGDATGGTSPAEVMRGLPFGYAGNVAFLVAASLLACFAYASYFKLQQGTLLSGLLLLPQSYIVVLAAVGPVRAIISGHYADGTPRPWAFIAADQINPVLVAVFHQISFWFVHAGYMWRRR